MHSGIRWLIAVHLVLLAAPLAMLTYRMSMNLLPLTWLVASLPIGSLMSLGIWLGLGPQRLTTRMLVSFTAVIYAVSWQIAAQVIEQSRAKMAYEWRAQLLEGAALYLMLVAIIGGVFLISRRWWKLTLRDDDSVGERKRILQFSLLGLIVLTTAVAVVVSLSRATRNSIDAAELDSGWFVAASFALFLIAFLANTYCAVHAVLRPGSVTLSTALVMVVSAVLGIALSLAMRQDQAGLFMLLGGTVISVAPTVVVIGSLLVVRSCGYRLVRHFHEPGSINSNPVA